MINQSITKVVFLFETTLCHQSVVPVNANGLYLLFLIWINNDDNKISIYKQKINSNMSKKNLPKITRAAKGTQFDLLKLDEGRKSEIKLGIEDRNEKKSKLYRPTA